MPREEKDLSLDSKRNEKIEKLFNKLNKVSADKWADTTSEKGRSYTLTKGKNVVVLSRARNENNFSFSMTLDGESISFVNLDTRKAVAEFFSNLERDMMYAKQKKEIKKLDEFIELEV